MDSKAFFEEVREGAERADILLMVSVPVVLILVHMLPTQIQQRLVLDYQHPTIWTLFGSAYVHRGLDHLTGNVVSYGMAIVPTYLLCVLAAETKTFRYTFLSFVFLLPFAIPLVDLPLLDPNTGAGFSGVASAFVGFLPVALFLFLHNRISRSIAPSHAIVLFLLAAEGIVLTYIGISLESVLIFLSVVGLVVYDSYKIGIGELKEVAGELSSHQHFSQLVLVSVVFFFVSPSILFPGNIVRGGTTINILAHYVGFSLGFLGPYLYLSYRQWSENEEANGVASLSFGR